MKAFLNLRHVASTRYELFERGLKRIGFKQITAGIGKADLFVTWNRIRTADAMATEHERAGLPVIVAENASWGDMVADRIHVTRGRHNTAGVYPIGDGERWDKLQVLLQGWRENGETVVLAQRGFGAPPTAMPRSWPANQRGRLRPHPGKSSVPISLEADLARAGRVVTWGSAAAVQALAWGIRVESHMPNWIAQQDNTDDGRLAMFRRLAWAQWSKEEIGSGEAFKWLLQ